VKDSLDECNKYVIQFVHNKSIRGSFNGLNHTPILILKGLE